uniref:Putative cell division cycle protein n=1 Tax=Trypanosoma congolense (strain IL3000) TaxID=1068625 RepID=G0UJ39_TRYCI|nr:putative cell division cycle protein [Trypanosoma congolense IL3000]
MYTGSGLLILAAPVAWWPPASQLHLHPLEPQRTFFSAITDTGATIGAGRRLMSLSRLGRSVVLGGQLIATPPHLLLYNPFTGRELSVVVSVEGGTVDDGNFTFDAPTLCEFVRSDRVRVVAAVVGAGVPLTELLRKRSDAVNSFKGDVCSNDENYTGKIINSLFSERYVEAALRYMVQQLQRSPRPTLCSMLLHGEHGVGKTYVARQLMTCVPSVVKVHDCSYMVECREMSIAALLALNEREVVATICSVFAFPPVEAADTNNNCTTHSSGGGQHGVLLIVVIDRVDLLVNVANPMVMLAAHQLCTILDELQGRQAGTTCTAVTIATAENTSALPTALLARLARHQVNLVHPTLEERRCFVVAHTHAQSSPDLFPPHVLERAAEALAGRSAGQLKAMKSEAVLQLLEREALCSAKESGLGETESADTPEEYSGLVGMSQAIRAVEELLVWPLQQRKLLHHCRVQAPRGLVVYGPPGTGKTALLTGLARRLQGIRIHVLLVDGLSLIEKEVGRTEKNIASLFAAARAASPTALFLDNMDSLAPPRGRQTAEVSTTADRSLSTLLTEMDGIGGGSDCAPGGGVPLVFVVAAAPSPEALDPAVCRPGRLDLHITLSPPTSEVLQRYVVGRLLEAVDVRDKSNVDSEAALGDTAATVEAHVRRWLANHPHATMADANDFVRSALLCTLVETTVTTVSAQYRLREFLARAAPL